MITAIWVDGIGGDDTEMIHAAGCRDVERDAARLRAIWGDVSVQTFESVYDYADWSYCDLASERMSEGETDTYDPMWYVTDHIVKPCAKGM